MDRRLARDRKRHAVLAAFDQDGFAAGNVGKLGRGGSDLRVGDDGPMHGGGELPAIGRQQCRAAIDAVVMALGVDDDGFAHTVAPHR